MTTELKPCPFCGSVGRMTYSDRGEVFQVRCINWTGDAGSTSCMGGGAYAYSEAEAIAAWNRRAAPAVPDGGVMVPVEPTRKMLTEAHRCIDWCRPATQNTNVMDHPSQDDGGTTCEEDLRGAYAAMLAAAPSPSEKD